MPFDMPASPKSARQGNGLALLANKCASRTFDISSGMVYASMRDQIVRAQLLVRDLKLKDPQCRRLLIIGAGVAGITAACCANELGIEAVVLESADEPFSLQAGVTKRMVGPFMYEWPNIVAGSQNYPLEKHGLGGAIRGTPSWIAPDPISAHDFAIRLKNWLKKQKFDNPKPRFLYGVDAEETRSYVRKFVDVTGQAKDDEPPITPPPLQLKKSKTAAGELSIAGPDYIVLAVGMGTEQTQLVEGINVEGAKFWADDDFCDTPDMSWDVGVFGGGDGALQDVLRLTTRHSHPLEFIKALEVSSMAKHMDEIRPWLDSLEQQSRLLATWSDAPVFDLIDQRCKVLCAELVGKSAVIETVLSQLRKGTGTVFHVYSGQGFGKAYLLNRFCMHLIAQCLTNLAPAGVVGYVPLPGTKATHADKSSGKYIVKLDNQEKLQTFDRIAVRFGPGQKALKAGQLIQLSDKTQADRVSMSAIPLPYVVAL